MTEISPEISKFLTDNITFNKDTGRLSAKNGNASVAYEINFKGEVITVSQSELVWLKVHGEWPPEGKRIEHINGDTLDCRPENLRLT